MNSRRFMPIVLAIVSASFSACGSGSGSTTAPPPPVTTYTIGGSVSGFSGTGVFALQNNGDDNVQIYSSGNFTFGKPIATGSPYSVTILSEPNNPVQFCVVSNGSGTVDANVTSVQVTCTTPSEQTLYSFGAQPDGNYPSANLVFDVSGNLYGTTLQGGAFGYGTVFKLTPNASRWTETAIYSFCRLQGCEDGSSPYSTLVVDAAGNLYGTALNGGIYGGATTGGVVFELTPQLDGTWAETVLHSFGNGADGIHPQAGLVFDKAGNLYGTTTGGGAASASCTEGCGTVFELSPGSNAQWTEKVLYSFCSQGGCVDGDDPEGGVILDATGNLFGTTVYGGTPNRDGTVFELSPGANGQWVDTVLYTFQGGSVDGANPNAGVAQDNLGNLYGTTQYGYAYPTAGINNGTVFKLAHGSGGQWTESVLYGFCSQPLCADGAQPLGGVVLDKAGNVYGATFGGGSNEVWGTVFALTPNAANTLWNEVVLFSFKQGPEGFNPHLGVISDSAGNLYGTAYQGGAGEYGTVVEVTP
jgi:uncharacterized repeat protein (TIGR03803 family)